MDSSKHSQHDRHAHNPFIYVHSKSPVFLAVANYKETVLMRDVEALLTITPRASFT